MVNNDFHAHEQIRQTLARNADAIGSPDELAATYTTGAVLTSGRRTRRGRAAIRTEAEFRRRRPRIAGTPSGPGSIEIRLVSSEIAVVGPVTARARSRFVAVSGLGVDHSGHYDDVLRKEGGVWLIARREVVVESAVRNSTARADLIRPGRSPVPVTGMRRPAVAGPSVAGRGTNRRVS